MGTHGMVLVVDGNKIVWAFEVYSGGQIDLIGLLLVEAIADSKKNSVHQLVDNLKSMLNGDDEDDTSESLRIPWNTLELTDSMCSNWKTTLVKKMKKPYGWYAFGYTIELTSEGVYMHYSDDPTDHERLTVPEFRQLIDNWEMTLPEFKPLIKDWKTFSKLKLLIKGWESVEDHDLGTLWDTIDSDTRHHVLGVLINAAKAAVTPEDVGPQNKKRRTD